jgi:hypothetical protein
LGGKLSPDWVAGLRRNPQMSPEMLKKWLDVPLYRIIDINNLSGIIKTKGIWSDRKSISKAYNSVNIAHASIKERRLKSQIPVFPGATLGDFVPFYFCNRSPML